MRALTFWKTMVEDRTDFLDRLKVLSPSDRPRDIMEKGQGYLDAGTRLVWVIDPEARAVAAFRPNGPPTFLTEDDSLDGGDVLPGFTLSLQDLI